MSPYYTLPIHRPSDWRFIVGLKSHRIVLCSNEERVSHYFVPGWLPTPTTPDAGSVTKFLGPGQVEHKGGEDPRVDVEVIQKSILFRTFLIRTLLKYLFTINLNWIRV